MSLVNQLDSIVSFLESTVAGSEIKKEVPANPTSDTVVVRMLKSETNSETRYHYRTDYTYQIVVYGSDSPSVLGKMDAISRKINDGKTVIPIEGTMRFIRAKSFSFSAAFKTESKLAACIGVMPTEIREARTQEEYQKMMHVYHRFG